MSRTHAVGHGDADGRGHLPCATSCCYLLLCRTSTGRSASSRLRSIRWGQLHGCRHGVVIIERLTALSESRLTALSESARVEACSVTGDVAEHEDLLSMPALKQSGAAAVGAIPAGKAHVQSRSGPPQRARPGSLTRRSRSLSLGRGRSRSLFLRNIDL